MPKVINKLVVAANITLMNVFIMFNGYISQYIKVH